MQLTCTLSMLVMMRLVIWRRHWQQISCRVLVSVRYLRYHSCIMTASSHVSTTGCHYLPLCLTLCSCNSISIDNYDLMLMRTFATDCSLRWMLLMMLTTAERFFLMKSSWRTRCVYVLLVNYDVCVYVSSRKDAGCSRCNLSHLRDKRTTPYMMPSSTTCI
jgi:hypothetical protein